MNNIRFKLLAIAMIAFSSVTFLNAQFSMEEGLRNDFVKSLQKRRKANSGNKTKPVLGDNAKKNPQEKPIEDEDTILIETQLVRLDVQVFDDRGNPILGLKPEDFVISEIRKCRKSALFPWEAV